MLKYILVKHILVKHILVKHILVKRILLKTRFAKIQSPGKGAGTCSSGEKENYKHSRIPTQNRDSK
jgi:hypothetical protein